MSSQHIFRHGNDPVAQLVMQHAEADYAVRTLKPKRAACGHYICPLCGEPYSEEQEAVSCIRSHKGGER